jgi:FixJ family two-component response regulator
MSGYTDDDIVRRGFIEPSRKFLQKPFTSEGLLQTVRKVLDEG